MRESEKKAALGFLAAVPEIEKGMFLTGVVHAECLDRGDPNFPMLEVWGKSGFPAVEVKGRVYVLVIKPMNPAAGGDKNLAYHVIEKGMHKSPPDDFVKVQVPKGVFRKNPGTEVYVAIDSDHPLLNRWRIGRFDVDSSIG
jgi:hypothetical protein